MTNCGWTGLGASYNLPNSSGCPVWYYQPDNMWEMMAESNAKAKASLALGFTFDSSPLPTRSLRAATSSPSTTCRSSTAKLISMKSSPYSNRLCMMQASIKSLLKSRRSWMRGLQQNKLERLI